MAYKAPILNIFAPLLPCRPPPLGMTRPAYCNVDANPYTRVQALLTQRLRMPACAAGRPTAGFAERLAAACAKRTPPELSAKPFVRGVDVADVHVLRAVGEAFDAFKPPHVAMQQALLRQIALDGGVRPQGTSPYVTLRFKYAFDGCGSFRELSSRVAAMDILQRVRDSEVARGHMVNCAPGASLLGDYLYVPGTEQEAAPPPAAVRRSQLAGDFLAPLLFTQDGTLRGTEDLTLQHSAVRDAEQLQLTQAVGRAEDGSVSHLATVRWSDTGAPVATVHTNFLAPTARPAPMTFIISGRVSVAARAAAVYATAPARNAATASALSSPALPIPAPSARSPAYPYLSPAPAKPGDASPGWNAVARGPAPKWPKPSKPLKPLARARMRVLEASNANVPRQPCAFHFNKPHGAYWLTWQRFHILARWRGPQSELLSIMPTLPITPHHPRFSGDVAHAADWDGHRPFNEAAFGFGACAPLAAVNLLCNSAHTQHHALKNTPRRGHDEHHTDTRFAAARHAARHASAPFAVACAGGWAMPRPTSLKASSSDARVQQECWDRDTVQSHAIHGVASYLVHENATRPAGSRSLVEITRRALDRMLYNARLGAWIRPIFPFAATDRGSADWAPESRRNQASMEPRAVESDCLPYARIAGSSGAALLAQHEGLQDAQTPGLFQAVLTTQGATSGSEPLRAHAQWSPPDRAPVATRMWLLPGLKTPLRWARQALTDSAPVSAPDLPRLPAVPRPLSAAVVDFLRACLAGLEKPDIYYVFAGKQRRVNELARKRACDSLALHMLGIAVAARADSEAPFVWRLNKRCAPFSLQPGNADADAVAFTAAHMADDARLSAFTASCPDTESLPAHRGRRFQLWGCEETLAQDGVRMSVDAYRQHPRFSAEDAPVDTLTELSASERTADRRPVSAIHSEAGSNGGEHTVTLHGQGCDPPRDGAAPRDYDTHPHAGVYPVVTPPDWDVEVASPLMPDGKTRATRWLLELPLKSLGAACGSVEALDTMLARLSQCARCLQEEGWRLDGIFDGMLFASAPMQRGYAGVAAAGRHFVAALAFGVAREVRTVRRGPPPQSAALPVSCAAHRHRSDPYHPCTPVDTALLRHFQLPSPLELDDMLPMQQAAREAALLRAAEILAPQQAVEVCEHALRIKLPVRAASSEGEGGVRAGGADRSAADATTGG